jgi:hypothetical protein
MKSLSYKQLLTYFCLFVLFMSGCAIFTVQPAVQTLASTPASTITSQVSLTPTLIATSQPTITIAPAPTQTMVFQGEWNDRTPFAQGLISSEKASLDDLVGNTVYRIDFSVSPDFLTIQGNQEVHYTNCENQPLDRIYFYLHPNRSGGEETLTSVTIDQNPVEPVYVLDRIAAYLPLPTKLQPEKTITINMNFSVSIAQEMGGNYGLFGYLDNILLLDEFYPLIPVYDEQGWRVQVPSPNGDVTYNDAAFYEVRVTLPSNLTVVTSGIETYHQSQDDLQTLTFIAGPARDFYLAASEQFMEFSEQEGETTINSYSFAGNETSARAALDAAQRALQSFNTRFGPYPYTELDIISTPMQALGMEYPGLVAIAFNLYDPSAVIYNTPTSHLLETTVVHEVAHQWFYNQIGDDQLNQPWLDEAMAQYSVYLYFLDTYGEAQAKTIENSWMENWSAANYENEPIGLPTGSYSANEYGAIIYGRGPMFLLNLAENLGQETFDTFLKDYVRTYKWGIATTSGFEQLAEKDCNCDLAALFQEWVY